MSSPVRVHYKQVDRVGSDVEHSEAHAAPQVGCEPSSRSTARTLFAENPSMMESSTIELNSR